jgi:hypothetical protein
MHTVLENPPHVVDVRDTEDQRLLEVDDAVVDVPESESEYKSLVAIGNS